MVLHRQDEGCRQGVNTEAQAVLDDDRKHSFRSVSLLRDEATNTATATNILTITTTYY